MKPSPQGPMIKSPHKVKAECSTANISTEDTIYFYCFKGARAQHPFWRSSRPTLTTS